MHDAVLTFDEQGTVKTCNPAGLRILKVRMGGILEQQASAFSADPTNGFFLEAVHENEEFLDAELQVEGETLSVASP